MKSSSKFILLGIASVFILIGSIYLDKRSKQNVLFNPREYVRTIENDGITCVIFRHQNVGGIDCDFPQIGKDI